LQVVQQKLATVQDSILAAHELTSMEYCTEVLLGGSYSHPGN
jgi:hypothetical protein